MNTEPILAIDGTGLLVRCSRAARHQRLFSPGGEPTGALMMFINSVARKIRATEPGYVVVAWDGPHATRWRRGMYLGYKAGQPDVCKMGGELDSAMEFLDAAGIYQLSYPGFEADDILAAVTRRAMNMPGILCLVCSDDQDLHQLADDCPDHQVEITGLTRDYRVTAQDVRQQWGVSPVWLPQIRALAGDKSDGIPGLPGVGPVKALKMRQAGGRRWPLPETVLKDPELRSLVVIWKDIMDLVIPVRPVEHEMGIEHLRRLGTLGRWNPDNGQNVLNLLERYGMEQIAQRLQRGGLW
jgi:5'-3' exonuclease